MPNQRGSLSDPLGAKVSLALRRVKMEYHAGYEVTCEICGLLCCVDKKFLREELEYHSETILNNNSLHIEKRRKFNYR